MFEGQSIFTQLMSYVPWRIFNTCVKRYKGNNYCKTFTCHDQFLAMTFAQLTLREGLRGIQETLAANAHCLYHMGFRCKAIPRSTLARANEVRSWRIYAELAMKLMAKARKLYQNEPFGVDLDAKVFAVDSTTIDLCLSQFLWAPFQHSKAAVKMHVSLDLHGNIPDFIVLSPARVNDLVIFETLKLLPGAYYIFDRGYFSFKHLYRINGMKAFYVIRPMIHVRYEIVSSTAVDKSTGILCDHKVKMTGQLGKVDYPEHIRRIKYRDPETNRPLVFYTNDFTLPALLIAKLYKQRWQVELFFKWIKQHLKIKQFYGTSENAVRTQLWIAVSVYCLLAIIKKELRADRELHEIQEILSASVFQKMPILQAFSRGQPKHDAGGNCNQLTLF